MKIILTTLALVLCFQINAYSMLDCDCDWTIDIVCIQMDDGNIIPFPNECWANCMGYSSDDFIDCDYDTTYDPACGCSFEIAPVCIAAPSGDILLYPNSCAAECNGYNTDDFLDCNYDIPINPSCGCDYEINEVCVEVEEGVYMPFPNECWASCMGYEESDYVNCNLLFEDEIEIHETVEYLYNIIIDSVDVVGEDLPSNNLNQQKGNKIEQEDLVNKVVIYPNPIDNNDLNLKINLTESANLKIDLMDVTGKLYKTISHSGVKGFEVVKVAVNDLPAGIYYLNIFSGRYMMSRKFVKGK